MSSAGNWHRGVGAIPEGKQLLCVLKWGRKAHLCERTGDELRTEAGDLLSINSVVFWCEVTLPIFDGDSLHTNY